VYREPAEGTYHVCEFRRRGETVTPVRLPAVTVRVDDFMP